MGDRIVSMEKIRALKALEKINPELADLLLTLESDITKSVEVLDTRDAQLATMREALEQTVIDIAEFRELDVLGQHIQRALSGEAGSEAAEKLEDFDHMKGVLVKAEITILQLQERAERAEAQARMWKGNSEAGGIMVGQLQERVKELEAAYNKFKYHPLASIRAQANEALAKPPDA